ncbi:PIN domain-containing protein [Streptomyces sp. NBC_01537]|uniref:PIN domain-containing protein n=1 Tax=Streptomyces sp. NBC_01537 TaxID=2903896 RepID=UPI00386D94C6
MIRYLIDSSALWRIQRDKDLRTAWTEAISSGVIGSCQPQRTEFRRSARNRAEFDAMTELFADLYPDVAVPKSAWRWTETAQYRLSQLEAHQALSALDLIIAATAAHYDLVVLHDDTDFVTLAGAVQDLRERNIHDAPA